jgi:hypothetical protein
LTRPYAFGSTAALADSQVSAFSQPQPQEITHRQNPPVFARRLCVENGFDNILACLLTLPELYWHSSCIDLSVRRLHVFVLRLMSSRLPQQLEEIAALPSTFHKLHCGPFHHPYTQYSVVEKQCFLPATSTSTRNELVCLVCSRVSRQVATPAAEVLGV